MQSPTVRAARRFLIWYAATFVGLFGLLGILLVARGAPLSIVARVFKQAFGELAGHWLFWLILLVPYLVFLWLRAVLHGYRRGGVRGLARSLALRVALPIMLVVGVYKTGRWYAASESFEYVQDDSVHNTTGRSLDRYSQDGKHRGVHLFGGAMTETQLAPLLESNVEWIAHVPFGWQDSYDDPDVRFTSIEGIEWSAKDQHHIDHIELARAHGIRNIVKPHLWLTSGRKWRSDIAMSSLDHWDQWFDGYRSFILHYARLCEQYDVDALCIGTELHETVRQRPQDWSRLIAEVRSVYSGAITYAANWNDPLEEIPFWAELDYIGVQAYFPLTSHRHPTVDELVRDWTDHVDRLEALAGQFNKPILFTELGYKSVPDAAIQPWQWPRWPGSLFRKVSMETQYNCYEAFFRVLWTRDWFAGAYIWQWQTRHDQAGGPSNPAFTPQNKPAQNCMARWFGQ